MSDSPIPRTGPILVGVDFSNGSERALAWAVDAAIAFDTPLIVLHVAHDPAESPGYYVRKGSGESDEIEGAAMEMMQEFIEDARVHLSHFDELPGVETLVVVGLPVTRILEVAAREGARMIVMGAHGRSALADALLGSKVERVTRLAPIPVVVVKAQAGDGESSTQ